MSRSSLNRAAAVAVLAGALVLCAPTRADEAGIEGRVDSMMELQLDPAGAEQVAATVTATVGRTRVSASPSAGDRSSRDFATPVTAKRVVVRAASSAGDAGTTITFGPQGP